MPMRKKLALRQSQVNAALENIFAKGRDLPQKEVFAAMEYSLLAGGKRLRPVLFLEFAGFGGLSAEEAMPFACALEMIHTYSLIHDDLPCMDDDDFRRGRPTSHKMFGEAMALLAGDGLLTGAFELMLGAEGGVPAENRLAAAYEIASAAGCFGMIGGQVLDLANQTEKARPDGAEPFRVAAKQDLTQINRLKTGALFRASCRGGLLLAGIRKEKYLAAAERFADALGISFQIQDDILDVIGDSETLGKQTGNDEKQGKATYVALWGLEKAQSEVRRLTAQALDELSVFAGLGDPAFLSWLVSSLSERTF